VRLGETTDHREFVTVRSRARFAPLPSASSLSEQMHFGDPVLLLRAPFRLSFAYAGPDRVWQNTWRGVGALPAMVRLTVRDARTERVLSVSTVTPVHVQVASDCVRPDGSCGDKSNASSSAPEETRVGTAGQGAPQ
jgi:general secretion pathway protein J